MNQNEYRGDISPDMILWKEYLNEVKLLDIAEKAKQFEEVSL